MRAGSRLRISPLKVPPYRLNNIGTDWGTYEFDLDPADFFVWPNGKGAQLPAEPPLASATC